MAMTRPRPAAARPVSAVPARRGRPGYDRQALLAVAVAVFNERGYDGTSMQDLSRRLGIAKSSIYYHVDGKEDLLRMALEHALDGLFSVVAQAPLVWAGMARDMQVIWVRRQAKFRIFRN